MEYSALLFVIPALALCAIVLRFSTSSSSHILPNIVGAVVIIAILGSVLVPAIDGFTSSPSDEWYYDDYQPCAANCEASGSLEVVSLGSKSFLHAKGLGVGSYSSSGKTYNVTVAKAPLDVYMLAGQSNAAYAYYDVSQSSPTPLPGTAYYYGTSSTVAQSWNGSIDDFGIYSMVNGEGVAYIGDSMGPFSAKYYELTGHKTLLVNTAIAGTSIALFQPGQSGYTHMETFWQDALSKINTDYYDVQVKSYIWIQGESDAGRTTSEYSGLFVAMNHALTDKTGDFGFNSAIISQVRPAISESVAIAQSQVASAWPNIYLGTTIAQTFTIENGLLREDNLHYTQLGDNILGVKLAEYAASLR